MAELREDRSRTIRRDLIVSLSVLTVLIAFALSGLAFDENWRKLLRVLTGFSAYVVVLLSALAIYGSTGRRAARLPFRAFALAGGAAEISSGWLRPEARMPVDILTAMAAALLIGGAHWLALRAWRPLYEKISARSGGARELTSARSSSCFIRRD